MRVVVDTNVLVSALLIASSPAAQIVERWRARRFDLLTSPEQLDELRRVTRYPRIRERVAPALAGRLVNDLRERAVVVGALASVAVSADPNDDHLLALAGAGAADMLVTGDKRDLLSLARHGRTRIVSIADFLRWHVPVR